MWSKGIHGTFREGQMSSGELKFMRLEVQMAEVGKNMRLAAIKMEGVILQ